MNFFGLHLCRLYFLYIFTSFVYLKFLIFEKFYYPILVSDKQPGFPVFLSNCPSMGDICRRCLFLQCERRRHRVPDLSNEPGLANEPDLANELDLANEPDLSNQLGSLPIRSSSLASSGSFISKVWLIGKLRIIHCQGPAHW